MSLNNCVPYSLPANLARADGYMQQTSFDFELPIWVFVNPKYLTDCTVQTVFLNDNGQHDGSITGSQDHPSFAATRERLERDGYIGAVPWWNGDTVLKPFYFNNVYLDVDDGFKCAAAVGEKSGMFIDRYNNGKVLEGVRNYKKEGEEIW
jgi:hypothetical protein